ncbi:hypothetical protein N7490_006330 [Penicillium lividum]|nr:hypothetical protein N7490_006330 [Penicillium lividum]
MPVASRDVYTNITEDLSILQLPHDSQLLASKGSSSSLTQSSLDFVPPPLHHLPSVYKTHYNTDTLPPYKGAQTGLI